jgi:hypothetical protein
MSIFSKDYRGYHAEFMGLKLSLLKDHDSGWSGATRSLRLRLLNTRSEFARSYWISGGKRIHSKTVVKRDEPLSEYRYENRKRKLARQIKDGNYKES